MQREYKACVFRVSTGVSGHMGVAVFRAASMGVAVFNQSSADSLVVPQDGVRQAETALLMIALWEGRKGVWRSGHPAQPY